MEIFALFPSLFHVMWPRDSPDTITTTTTSITVSVSITTLSSFYCGIVEAELWRREQHRMKPEWKSHFKCGRGKLNPNLWNSPEIKRVSVSLKGQCLPDSSGDGNKQLAAASLLLPSCARRCWRPEHHFFFLLKTRHFWIWTHYITSSKGPFSAETLLLEVRISYYCPSQRAAIRERAIRCGIVVM